MRNYNRQIPINNLKLILARSGNQCAFPDCTHPIFDDKNLFIAQLCHIEGVSRLGQRHNPYKSDKETNSYDNLLFLCYRHHKETDDVDLYPVQRLREIKATHEAKFKESTYKYSNEVLHELIKETNSYWERIDELHAKHIVPELAVPIDTKSNILTLINEVNDNLGSLHEINMILMSECMATHFEYICLGFPNLLTRISVAIDQIEIKYLEELILKNAHDDDLKAKLKYLRDNFEETSQSAGLAD